MADIDRDDEERKEKKHPYLLWGILLVITVMLLSGVIVAYVASRSYNEALAAAAPFSAPDSGLSQSLFVAQNTEYKESSDYPLAYHFGSFPYVCNIPDRKYVKLGNGIVANDKIRFFYATECDNDSISTTFIDELSYAVLSTADKSRTEMVTVGTDRGFFNGFDVAFMAARFTVYDENRESEVYTISYIFPIENTGKSAIMTIVYGNKRYAEQGVELLQDWAQTFREEVREEENK
ncbi:MAG: hypothetical protein IKH06_07360 [Clostridiales bacterium]|nr:hypothetical protein [Clostridiales bacterium]